MTNESPLSILVTSPQGDERRVGATPETVAALVKHGFKITIQPGAGRRAFFADDDYRAAGADIAGDSSWTGFGAVLTVSPWSSVDGPKTDEPTADSAALVIGFLDPFRRGRELISWADAGVSAAAVELVPRITRAQSMDALSSQASVAGYKAILLAADTLAQYFPLLMTAAGTVSPARVVVMGGGVAGLQALATAKRLGAVVEVSDIREAVREQVESLGGRFIDLPETDAGGEGEGGYAREMTSEYLAEQRLIVAGRVADADVVICTAQVPGKRAPLLVTRDMVESMRPGSVIVDLAAGQGGNCELTEPDRTTEHRQVSILGPTNLAAALARDASKLYARNLQDLLLHLTGGVTRQPVQLDLDDEITCGVLVAHEGSVVRQDIVGTAEEE